MVIVAEFSSPTERFGSKLHSSIRAGIKAVQFLGG
jgi:hypothetical protein